MIDPISGKLQIPTAVLRSAWLELASTLQLVETFINNANELERRSRKDRQEAEQLLEEAEELKRFLRVVDPTGQHCGERDLFRQVEPNRQMLDQ